MNVKEIIKKMTIDEKISLLEGKNQWQTNNIDRLSVPSIWLSDGPHGIRKEIMESGVLGLNKTEVAVSFPTESTLACSFDKLLAFKYGQMLGREARNKGVHIVLGPGVNIKRNPLCGRNFEYYSEDPVLSGFLAKEVIKGIESNNVAACIKHFACNSQEKYRMTIDSIVDERALREIYLKSFEIAAKSGVSSIMTSYNKLNGSYTSENEHLIKDILRDEWKYKGIVMTDWGGINNRVRALNAGCDLEMPTSFGYHSKLIKEAYLKGEVRTDTIDESVQRILNAVNKYSENISPSEEEIANDLVTHHQEAKNIASQCSVLLKNDGNVLPLREFDKVLFVGSLMKRPRFQGGGSSMMNVHKLENMYDNINLYTNNYDYADGYTLEGDGYNQELINEAVNKAKNYNKVVVLIGLFDHYEAEGYDRNNLNLPEGQIKLIEELYKTNKNIIACVVSGSVVNLSFNGKTKALLYSGLGGESGALAILDNLYGKVNPSGRLAESFAISSDDYPSSKNYNQTNNASYFSESIFVGYRYFQTFNKKTVYPFGYGLSYSQFQYSKLKVSSSSIAKTKKIKVSVDVKNTSNLTGKEVVMVFVENNDSPVFKAKRELKDFSKIELKPNETKTVEFELDYNDFSYYDTVEKRFICDAGTYKIQICKNAEEVILEKAVERKDEIGSVKYDIPAYYRKDRLVVSDKDFEALYGKTLPLKVKGKIKTVTMENNLEDVEDRLLGRLMKKIIFKVAKNMGIEENGDYEANILYTPFKTLALYAGKDFHSGKFEGVVDILNHHFIRGIKKITKG